jgi:hypothetical protein
LVSEPVERRFDVFHLPSSLCRSCLEAGPVVARPHVVQQHLQLGEPIEVGPPFGVEDRAWR